MKNLLMAPVRLALGHPKKTIAMYLILTVILGLQLGGVRIDTDPENMLSESEPVRLSHSEIKREFALYDTIVVGVVDERYEEGVFRGETLERIADVTSEILKIEGVIASDVISPTTTDDIQSGGGLINIEPLYSRGSSKSALEVRDAALDNPILRDMLVSADGKAIALYIPIREKSESYRISKEIEAIISEKGGVEEYHIAGLPVAEDTFGIEMFKQMGISAPLAGLIIFLLMMYFFRKFILVAAGMTVAMVTVIWTMGLLTGTGYTLHIMSSMIPIFLMPVAVLDSIHILSEFHDRYRSSSDRKTAILSVMDSLSMPMLFTSITSAIGFLSLVTTPIPPVRVFGAFVGFGILAAWVLTITLIPALIALLPEKTFKKFGMAGEGEEEGTTFARRAVRFISKWKGVVVALCAVLFVVSIYGTTKTVVNDNPVKWFKKSHPIRVADKVLNEHFGGTYVAYLVLDGNSDDRMKDPAVMAYVEKLQRELEVLDKVGKTTSYVDIIKKISYELHEDEAYNKIPDTAKEAAQYLFLYEMSGDPDDLYHLIDPAYAKSNIWVQLTSGDNKDMVEVVEYLSTYIEENPMPEGFEYRWGGLTYLNVVWQDKMVTGMLKALAGSAVIVLIIMSLLFRSVIWGAISMIPLSLTIAFIYGLVGFVGKDYDMPIAVLSALTLGISIDFAIHLCQRTRQLRSVKDSWTSTLSAVYGEPVRAISRNMVVITVGFLPLLFSSLMPYKTVGVFFATIMAVSGVATLLVLPALMSLLKKRLNLT